MISFRGYALWITMGILFGTLVSACWNIGTTGRGISIPSGMSVSVCIAVQIVL